MSKKRIAVTQLINITKCENQTMLNLVYKPKQDKEMRARQKEGIQAHKQFENLNNKYSNNTEKVVHQMNKRSDKRCYIATAIFGNNSEETILLRKWRDENLSTNYLGKIFIKAYYKLSPYLLRVSPSWMEPPMRKILNIFIKRIRK